MEKDNLRPYIIGETAYNHEGDIDYLYRMIDEIAQIRLNAVKFHLLLNVDSYIQKGHPLMDKIKRCIFTERQWDGIVDYSNKKGLDVICLCDDVESIEHILKDSKDVRAIEIHASGLNDYFLLDAASRFNGQVILGIGGSTLNEIKYAVDFLGGRGRDNIMLMYGFQSYPTRYEEINLSKMSEIKRLFSLTLGYADHTAFDDPNNEIVSIMAAVAGFNILEKHYTLDYGRERIDYQAAVGKEQMLRIKELMEICLAVYGNNQLDMSRSEQEYGSVGPMKKAIVAKRFIKKGERLGVDNLWFKRTVETGGVKQNQFLELLGLQAARDISKDEIIDFTKVNRLK